MTVESQVTITADVNLSDTLLDLVSSFAGLYADKWMLAAILITFFIGQVVHAVLRGYCPHMRDLCKALIIWVLQLVVGYVATHALVETDVAKLALLTGITSVALYYILLWVSTRWIKMPRLAMFLSLRETRLNDTGEVEFDKTIKFIRGNRE